MALEGLLGRMQSTPKGRSVLDMLPYAGSLTPQQYMQAQLGLQGKYAAEDREAAESERQAQLAQQQADEQAALQADTMRDVQGMIQHMTPTEQSFYMSLARNNPDLAVKELTKRYQKGTEGDKVPEWRAKYNLYQEDPGYRGYVDKGRAAGQSQVNVQVDTGAQELTGGAETDVQKQMVLLDDSSSSLQNIAGTFKPEFLEWGTQIKNWGRGIASKAGVLPEGEKNALAEFTNFKTSTLKNLNEEIKRITGAALSESEAERIIASLPNMDDDPVAFKAKLDASIADIQAKIKRKYGLLSSGVKDPSSSVSNDKSDADIMAEYGL